MTVALTLPTTTGRILVGTEWAELRSGVIPGVSEGSDVVLTVEAVATAGTEIAIRARSIVGGDETAAVVFDDVKPSVARLLPLTVDDVSGDRVVLEARRVSGLGGLVLIEVGGLQGTFADPGAPVVAINITNQTQSTSIEEGESASLSVSAFGPAPLSYEWEFNDPATTWVAVGVGRTLSVFGGTAEVREYRCKITDGVNTVYSEPVTVTITAANAPVFAVQPQDLVAAAGSAVTFSAEGIGHTNWDMWIDSANPVRRVTSQNPDNIEWTVHVATESLEIQFRLYGPGGVTESRWASLTVNAVPEGGITLLDVERE